MEIIFSVSVLTVKVVNKGPISNISAISGSKKITNSDIFLNGRKIRISKGLRDIARQINRFKLGTGVNVEIHIPAKGKERSVLKINKSKVSRVDKSYTPWWIILIMIRLIWRLEAIN